jgi:hypothetical protein
MSEQRNNCKTKEQAIRKHSTRGYRIQEILRIEEKSGGAIEKLFRKQFQKVSKL